LLADERFFYEVALSLCRDTLSDYALNLQINLVAPALKLLTGLHARGEARFKQSTLSLG
jgi:hypothetical protein